MVCPHRHHIICAAYERIHACDFGPDPTGVGVGVGLAYKQLFMNEHWGHHSYAYTTTVFGPRKKRKWLVYPISWCICKLPQSILIPPRACCAPPWWCILMLLYTWAVWKYTKKWYTPAIFLFFLGPNPVVVYLYVVPQKYLKIIDKPKKHRLSDRAPLAGKSAASLPQLVCA